MSRADHYLDNARAKQDWWAQCARARKLAHPELIIQHMRFARPSARELTPCTKALREELDVLSTQPAVNAPGQVQAIS
jgi:hypothetical protein